MFGLSQLYQMRGRVGRSDVAAYTYLLYPPGHQLSNEAKRRLKAMRELSHLGSGFELANRDLEIRGAGNIFGTDQVLLRFFLRFFFAIPFFCGRRPCCVVWLLVVPRMLWRVTAVSRELCCVVLFWCLVCFASTENCRFPCVLAQVVLEPSSP